MITTSTVRSARTGLVRTDVYRDGNLVGFVGHLPDPGAGFAAFLGDDERLGCRTDAADAIDLVARAAAIDSVARAALAREATR